MRGAELAADQHAEADPEHAPSATYASRFISIDRMHRPLAQRHGVAVGAEVSAPTARSIGGHRARTRPPARPPRPACCMITRVRCGVVRKVVVAVWWKYSLVTTSAPSITMNIRPSSWPEV